MSRIAPPAGTDENALQTTPVLRPQLRHALTVGDNKSAPPPPAAPQRRNPAAPELSAYSLLIDSVLFRFF